MRIEGLDEILKEIADHPGKKAHDLWKNFNSVFSGIYKKNRKALITCLEEPSRNDNLSIELIQNVRPPIIQEQYTDEVLRHLYNYLSSLSALVDYSLRITKKYHDKEIKPFIEKRDELIASDINHFMGNLRNYLLHYGVPPLGWNVVLKEEGYNECTYFLNSDDLLRWDGWDQEARSFIKKSDRVDLIKTVKEHGAGIDKVMISLLERFPELHSGDIEAVNRLIQRSNDILSGKTK